MQSVVTSMAVLYRASNMERLELLEEIGGCHKNTQYKINTLCTVYNYDLDIYVLYCRHESDKKCETCAYLKIIHLHCS